MPVSKNATLTHRVEGCTQPFVCPLSQVQAGTAVRIKQLSATPEVTHRLREMGFCEEQKIRLLSQKTNIICQVCNVRLGISSQLAEKILVEPLSAQSQAA
jgi:Fe2+ transport system protein FeoA